MMNIVKKYWDSVYIYVLLLVPGLCMCAGVYWTSCKLAGWYMDISWTKIVLFDCSQLLYLAISIFFIYQNRKDSSYIPEHLNAVKAFVVTILLIQYNVIMYLFSAEHVAECTFLFFLILTFLFDSKLMLVNIILYGISLLVVHIVKPEAFLPMGRTDVNSVIAYRILIFGLTSSCNWIVVYFVEQFLMRARQKDEENRYLLEKQLKYYKDVELLDTELRKFRHDINNHFICMEFLFNSGKMDELKHYFKDLQGTFSFKEKIYLSGNDVVDAILHYELSHYCNENIKVNVYGKLPHINTVSAMDLCTIFSNLLSNAMNAASKCAESKDALITIHFSGGNKYFSISMANSVVEGMRVKKNKDRNHGHGVNKIKEVLEKYNGRFERKVEDGVLTVTIYLPI